MALAWTSTAGAKGFPSMYQDRAGAPLVSANWGKALWPGSVPSTSLRAEGEGSRTDKGSRRLVQDPFAGAASRSGTLPGVCVLRPI